ncbi:glycosyltransferase [Echinicola jeungdonensis]|uniref:Glycosyltransferase n=1 Tax=Echinicola jeungdonensis TaxID=709343 RepID=A0ABV5J2F4_9BACT|nr:glycosyltransferase [Echinicola jeungdonensis]MDN3668169.1 glycosyltransferase [Echinicola jeungdonensis]
MYFSIIIPVYNRPDEIKELLESLSRQVYQNFEVIIVEDGSKISCREEVESFEPQMQIRYFYQENSGQGFARNYGMEKAKGDYFVFFDSDCLIPENYLKILNQAILEFNLDAHGGPDEASGEFSAFQKAINFSMTSFLTTGGIRGKVADPSKYQARGYNMGFSREVYNATQGFRDANQGEDIELSIRIKKLGFKLHLVREAFVYHKRRNDLKSFVNQGFSFGVNRVNVNHYHPGSIQAIHWMPAMFLLGALSVILAYFICYPYFFAGAMIYGIWTLGVLVSSSLENKSLCVGILSIATSYGQLLAYGAGLLWAKGKALVLSTK